MLPIPLHCQADKVLAQTALCVLFATFSAACPAAGSGNLGTGANVVGTCKISSSPGLLDFGLIDPSGAGNVTVSASFVMKCTKGTLSGAATDDGGLNNLAGGKRMQHSVTATAFVTYSVAYSSDAGFTGQGFGPAAATRTITVTGTITPAQFQNALVTTGLQRYSDTVTITVNP